MELAVSQPEKCFSEIASVELEKFEFNEKDSETLWREIISKETFPKQTFGLGEFGHPSFSLFANDSFSMDLYAWPISNISIHSHDFTGAFKVLGSDVLQVKFKFQEKIELEPGLNLGELSIISHDQLKRNEVCKIKPYRDFIHFIRHEGKNGLSLVMRTISSKMNKKPLSIYLYPGIECQRGHELQSISMKKLEIFMYSLTEMKIESLFAQMTDYELINVYYFLVTQNKFLNEIYTEFKTRKYGNEISEILKKHDAFFKKIDAVSHKI